MPLQALSLPVVALGVRGAAAPRPRLPAGAARPALRDRRGRLGRRGPRPGRAVLPRGRRRCSAGRPALPAPEGDAHDRIRAALAGSAEFWHDLLASDRPRGRVGAARAVGSRLGGRGDERRLAAAPGRAPLRRPEARAPAAAVLAHRATGHTATQGRWSLAERLFAGEPDRRALAELLLERQGIVTRDGVRGEGIAGGYGAVYGELKALETLGLCRRGYFVEGLGGAQFALGGAVERLRELRPRDDEEQRAARPGGRRPGAALRRGAAVAEAVGRARRPRRRRPRRPARRACRRSSSSAAGSRWCRCGIPIRSGCGSRSPPWSTTPAASRASAWRSSASTASPSRERVLPLLVEAGFLAGPRRAGPCGPSRDSGLGTRLSQTLAPASVSETRV